MAKLVYRDCQRYRRLGAMGRHGGQDLREGHSCNGRRVGAWFFVEGTGAVDGICYSTLGSGNTGPCDLSLTEGRNLKIFLVTCDADTTDCSNADLWTILSPMISTHT